MDRRTRPKKTTPYNSTYPKGGVSYSKDKFVVNQTLVFQIKFCGKSPALRVAAKRCVLFSSDRKLKENLTKLKMETLNLDQTVGKSIEDFYQKNDFGEDGGINKKFAWIKFGFFSIPIPNFEGRKNNVYFHDIHHIITDNNTTWKGESAVSAWEISAGGWGKHYVAWLLTLWAMGLGILFYTKSTLIAFEKGLTMRNALTSGMTKTELSNLTISEIRTKVSNFNKAEKSSITWSIISLSVFFLPFLIGGITLFGIVNLIIK